MFRHFIKTLNFKKVCSIPISFQLGFNKSISTSFIDNLNNKITANINFKDETVELNSKNDKDFHKVLKFPFLWLRDNCKCKKCHHEGSHSRIINWETFDVTVKPKVIAFDNQSDKLKIVWDDNMEHESEFEYNWLDERNFTPEKQRNYINKYYRPSKNLLNKQIFLKQLEYFEFQKIIDNDLDLFKWLHSLITNGVAIITNVPETENEVRILSNRVGFIRRTHYGEEFIVKAKEGTSNVAYLSDNLQMHTDLPYYDYAPGTNLLHCLVQSKSEGAQNLLTDGFYIAQKIKEEYPVEFKILSKVLVNWSDIGHEDNIPFHSIYRAPMICLDYEGNVNRINHSVPQRDSYFSVPIDSVQAWYKALEKFINLIYSEAFEIKTKEGTILCFDNSRFIHGRKKYEDTNENRRHIIGAYLDWDEIFSRYRVLQNKFQI